MKIKNIVILIFMVISLGLFPAKIYRSNKNRVCLKGNLNL